MGHTRRTFAALGTILAAVAALTAAPAAQADPVPWPTPAVQGPVTGPGSPWTGITDSGEAAAAGYGEREYFLSGTATAYRKAGTWDASGVWAVEPDTTAAYKTRVLVRTPNDAAKFNGTVVVEWLNVSAGFETAPDYLYARAEMLRRGYAWVGVSAQALGIDGPRSPIGFGGLKVFNPARYDSLVHPGDAYSYDIYTQVAAALRTTGPADLLAGLGPRRLIADGESQSALRMTTYYNAVQPLTRAYDGFLIHSRFPNTAPLGAGMFDPLLPVTRLRTDQAAPVLVTESETDVPYHFPARQPDSAAYRLWEMPGTSHADEFTGAAALGCDKRVNSGPQTYLMRAALRSLSGWVAGAAAPPSMPRITTDAAGGVVRDQHGNALGGIRIPQLDVPIATLTGDGNTGAGEFCFLTGTTVPFPAAKLDAMYADHASYVAAFDAAAQRTADAGAFLADDLAALHAEADAAPVPPGTSAGGSQSTFDVQAEVQPGSLSMSQQASGVELAPVTINGRTQQATGRINTVAVADLRGGTLGWSLTGRTTDFVSDTGGVIPAAKFTWTPSCTVTFPDSPSIAVAGSPGPVAAGALLCRQPENPPKTVSGGFFAADARVSLEVPAYTLAGRYTATLTLSLV
ncbi:alpha/beta hydrolase domain-containing protein [Yinghuangia soli]|uniref:WxL domain-containing protein n=1 Tax=Yinghuangia soli TaxID=2908204 RepID=A0AA41PTJ2_9ACTN|nr:alpha/beta hydrolase domain-containing protein [Yinghuangia soli]MCF2525625.1 WxL domain-containing protein [Yinghuangia soli]